MNFGSPQLDSGQISNDQVHHGMSSNFQAYFLNRIEWQKNTMIGGVHENKEDSEATSYLITFVQIRVRSGLKYLIVSRLSETLKVKIQGLTLWFQTEGPKRYFDKS